jgi:hypothetical protein
VDPDRLPVTRAGEGKLAEAAAELERGKPWAAPDDADAILRQARSGARLEFARGNFEAAEAAAREALARVEEADAPDEHAETLIVLAQILHARGREGEFEAAIAESIAVNESRGALVLRDQARELLESPVTVT